MKAERIIRIEAEDNVATALFDVKKAQRCTISDMDGNLLEEIDAAEDIPFCNKIALKTILKGEKIVKYGQPIGYARCTIQKGCLVQVHNTGSLSVEIPQSARLEIMRQLNLEKVD